MTVPMYALKLSSVIVIDGMPTEYVGPFKTYSEAEQWFIANADMLDDRHVENVTTISMTAPN